MKNKSGFIAPSRNVPALAAAVVLLSIGQPASAETYQSWSYLSNSGGLYMNDDHRPPNAQGSSSVEYNANNFAKSSIGFAGDGSLQAKIGISATYPTTVFAYSTSYYRDDGWQCDATACGTAVPLGAAFTTHLKQDGSFTLGTATFSLDYYLRTESTAYQFHFAVDQGEGPLRPSGAFSTENLVSGATSLTNLVSGSNADGTWIFNPLFNMVWEDNNGDGVYNFSYDLSFSGYTHGIDLGEELGFSARAYGSPGTRQFFDSYNSFHSTLIPEAGVEFYSDSGRRVGNSAAPIPEPETYAMLLAGLGLLGFVARWRKPQPA